MLSLHFEIEPGQDQALVGPAPYFRVAGNRLKVGPADLDVACYREGRWHFPTGSFAAVTARTPARISFETGAQDSPIISGPFAELRLAQGAIWNGDEALVAEFKEDSQSWWVYPGRVQCWGAVIAPVTSEAIESIRE
jgi:hypothetical protein